jgi:hypothetical protein
MKTQGLLKADLRLPLPQNTPEIRVAKQKRICYIAEVDEGRKRAILIAASILSLAEVRSAWPAVVTGAGGGDLRCDCTG